ncbi:MAG: cystathionine beta-lyase [Gemmatimonadaceae bacterium]
MNNGRFATPNPPVHRTSTVLFDSVAHLEEVQAGMRRNDPSITMYGTFGTPTTEALSKVLLAGEGGAGVAFAPSGLGAVSLALLSVLKSGHHVLIPDSVYGPTRELCDTTLAGLGITTEYYDPTIGGGIASLFRPNTAAVLIESPGSYTFEIQDVPAIVAAAKSRSPAVVTLMDNAWGSPGLFKPFDKGVDISIVPLTKYWGGHADLLIGAVFANEAHWSAVRSTAFALGTCTNADDAYLALRGARTVSLRLRQHEASALAVAHWLDGRPGVGRVLHPALPSCPGHDLWKRDCSGSNGLFSFTLTNTDGAPASVHQVATFVDTLVGHGVFRLGYSWGGYESLVMPAALPSAPNIARTARATLFANIVRLHVGLEPVDELTESLAKAFRAHLGG